MKLTKLVAALNLFGLNYLYHLDAGDAPAGPGSRARD
jgi:hypothetical protein